MSNKVMLIFGVPYQRSEEDKKGYLKVLNTGSTYPGSESFIGNSGLSTQFIIHTKAKEWVHGIQDYDKMLECAAQSLENLKVDSLVSNPFDASHQH
jgi:hypothetical protein